VTAGQATSEELALSLEDAIQRGLKNNLGALLSDQGRRHSQATRMRSMADLLPNVTSGVGNRHAGEPGGAGIQRLSGHPADPRPFAVFDLRGYVTQRVLDLSAIRSTQADRQGVLATEQSYQNSRDMVALVAGGLYLQTVAGETGWNRRAPR